MTHHVTPEQILHDLRQAWRTIQKKPGTAAISVLSLAIGLGANATIFSFVNALLLRPLPVKDSGELLEVWGKRERDPNPMGPYTPLSFPQYVYFRDHTRSFSGLAAFAGDGQRVSWIRNGAGETVTMELVSDNFFAVSGVSSAAGRLFTSSAEPPSVVVGYDLWRRLGGSSEMIGESWNLNGRMLRVIGVAPRGFNGMLPGLRVDVWVPLRDAPVAGPELHLESVQSSWLFGVGRLKPGSTPSAAEAEMQVLGNQFTSAHPNARGTAGTFPAQLIPGPFRKYVVAFMALLMAVMTLVLLIGCANAANILLAQATGRSREMAVRSALGASRSRLMWQTFHESLLLALLSGAAGYVAALLAGPLLMSLRPATFEVELNVAPDWRVGLFVFAVSLLTGFVFGLLPAWRGTQLDLSEVMKTGGRTAVAGRSRLRDALIISQVAVCLVLLVTGTLCVRSFRAAQTARPGFDPEQVFAATVDLGPFGYTRDKGQQAFARMLEEIRTVPGVESASMIDHLPLSTADMETGVNVPGRLPPVGKTTWEVEVAGVGPGYFRTMRTGLLRGREFGNGDRADGPGVAIVNEAFAQQFWPGEDAIGKRIVEGDGEVQQNLSVVGVVETGRYQSLGEKPKPFLFRPFSQNYVPQAALVVRMARTPAGIAEPLRRIVRGVDSRLALFEPGSMRRQLEFAMFTSRVSGILLGTAGVLALMLALSGLYGVIAYLVAQRRREIGVRMALGASGGDILRMVLRQALVTTASGVLIGLGLASAASRVLSGILYGVSATDGLTFAGSAAGLLGMALLASYFPARAALRVNPLETLRYE